MTEEVLFRGEYVDKTLVNQWLSNPENQRILQEEQAKEKAAAAEERKQQQQRQRAQAKSREKKAQENFNKLRQELGGPDVVISDEYAHLLWKQAYNMVDYEIDDEKRQKEYADEQRQMKESRKRQEKQREREAIARRELPERQLKMFLSGNHTYREPGLKLLAQEFRTGKLIKRMVGQQAYNRLVEYGKPGETWESLMNRLLDVAEKATTAEKNGLTIY